MESSPKDQLQPRLHTFDYVKPGDPIDCPKPQLFDVAAEKQIPVSDALFPTPWSISDVRWSPDSSRFTFLYNQRGHQVLRIVAVDAKTGAATALMTAVASVQSGWGNTTPVQIDLDAQSAEAVEALIRTHIAKGGTQVNINVVNADTILAAEKDPASYPELIVRVTGFSAYFASLSPQFRRIVVERVLAETGRR